MTRPPDLTPTEELFLETLAGRYRTGEHMWTFARRHTSTARSLADKGLVGWQYGTVEGTIRAWLTDAGKAAALSDTYVPPLPAMLGEGRWPEQAVKSAARLAHDRLRWISRVNGYGTDWDDLGDDVQNGWQEYVQDILRVWLAALFPSGPRPDLDPGRSAPSP